jgi:hypothetical protein
MCCTTIQFDKTKEFYLAICYRGEFRSTRPDLGAHAHGQSLEHEPTRGRFYSHIDTRVFAMKRVDRRVFWIDQ